MSTTLRIFGCSDKINDLNLHSLLIGHTNFGLNLFPCFGAQTTYWLYLDHPQFGSRVYIKKDLAYKPYLKFIQNFEDENHKGLFGAYTSATFALDFAIKEGYKRAELYGILDGDYKFLDNGEVEYKHFYDNKVHTMHENCLQSWKNEIMSYNNRIEIVIPYQTV